jgi:CII-binding regulator of phage lambda lysogenization HflD
MISSLLHQIAAIGYEEKEMLLGLGAIYRLVCSMLSLNPSVTRIPSPELLYTVGE